METLGQKFAGSDCQRRVLDGLSFLADGDLRDAPLDTTLADAGIRGNELGIVERNVNAARRVRGEPPLPSGTIKSTTTLQEVIDHVCG
jgi:hypothetical protein